MTTSGEKKVRSFIAIPVPSVGIEALEKVVKNLDQEIGRHVRWVRPEGIHVTLKFMGDIPAATVEELLEALPPVAAGFSSFELAISGLGVFPNIRRPRVLWAGLDGGLKILSELQAAVDEAVGKLGLPKEQRPFSPHLTLGRVRDRISPGARRGIILAMIAPSPASNVVSEPWMVEQVHLFRTTFTPQGSIHTSMGSVPLGTV